MLCIPDIYRDSKAAKTPCGVNAAVHINSEGRDHGSSCFFARDDPQETELLHTAVVPRPLLSGNLHSVLPREKPSPCLRHSNWPTRADIN